MWTYFLTLNDIKDICFSAARELYKFNEPLPELSTRFPHKLEAVLGIPETEVFGKKVHNTTIDQAACYFYYIIKNHPFLNGNKRIAVISCYVFLRLNDHELTASWEAIYDFAITISQPSKNHEKEFAEVVEFLKHNTRRRWFPLLF